MVPGIHSISALMHKDVRLYLEEAKALDVPLALSKMVTAAWRMAEGELGPDSDYTEIIKCMESRAGIVVGSSD